MASDETSHYRDTLFILSAHTNAYTVHIRRRGGSLYYTLGRARCVDVCPRIGELLYRRVRQEPGAKGGTYVGPP